MEPLTGIFFTKQQYMPGAPLHIYINYGGDLIMLHVSIVHVRHKHSPITSKGYTRAH